MRGTSPVVTAMDLDRRGRQSHRYGALYDGRGQHSQKDRSALGELLLGLRLDGARGAIHQRPTHPRAYGSFARLLGKYVREEGLIPLEEAIRKLTGFPAANLKLDRRGLLALDYYADVVVFDPATITDHATFEKPHQLATGVIHVFVNGEQVLRDGEHTGATPGRFVKGPGFKGASS